MGIKNNIDNFVHELSPFGARLVAVSKTHPPEKIREAYDAGQRIFGENKVQELTAKQEVLPNDIQWHMIGHLQSNKVKYIAPFISLIHSVDSFKLLEEINKQGKKTGRVIPCLLQVFIAQEETKFGFDAHELNSLLDDSVLPALDYIRIDGLMGMASLTGDVEKVRSEFKKLSALFSSISSRRLPPNVRMIERSMGMSSDYRIALEEGSTLVRVGTGVFGGRESTV